MFLRFYFPLLCRDPGLPGKRQLTSDIPDWNTFTRAGQSCDLPKLGTSNVRGTFTATGRKISRIPPDLLLQMLLLFSLLLNVDLQKPSGSGPCGGSGAGFFTGASPSRSW